MERLKIISSDISVVFESQLNAFLEGLEKQGSTYDIKFQKNSECNHCAYVLFNVGQDVERAKAEKRLSATTSDGREINRCREGCRFFIDYDTKGYCSYDNKDIHPYKTICENVRCL